MDNRYNKGGMTRNEAVETRCMKNRVRQRAEDRKMCADWDESQHPRDESGKFGEGGGSSKEKALTAKIGQKYGLGRVRSVLSKSGPKEEVASRLVKENSPISSKMLHGFKGGKALFREGGKLHEAVKTGTGQYKLTGNYTYE